MTSTLYWQNLDSKSIKHTEHDINHFLNYKVKYMVIAEIWENYLEEENKI